jgi:hypothetical protein
MFCIHKDYVWPITFYNNMGFFFCKFCLKNHKVKTNQIFEVETNNPFGNYVLITSSLFSIVFMLNVSNPLVCSFLFSIITNVDKNNCSIQKYKQHQKMHRYIENDM